MYHVTARGNVRQDIYLGDEDRETFLGFVSLACEREELICHAYCLMGNHYHLLVQTPGANIGSAMHRINCLHANRFNRVYGREGHVFERPYRASIMHGGRRELEAARYIDRNPVRAGLCAAPEQWRWSSHAALIGRAPCPAFLSTDRLTTWFGTDESEARERYRTFVDAGVDAPYERPPLESLVRRGDHATLSRRLAHAATEP
jgi:putative transposase